MKFEHLIEINDPLNPLLDALTIEQLWSGLVLRAEAPKLFVPQLDEAIIDERTDDSFRRRLRYGQLVIEDRVRLEPMQRVVYDVPAQNEITASTLTMSIEQPTADTLYVRFQYDDGHDAETDAANAMYDEFKRSAYKEADIDTVGMIRELATQGRLGATLN
ncbi:hypothetical protein J2X54_000101 [Duganella sp. 3397]|uniref:DUF1857 domain-containing protein n=1 Tax=Duganella phyllosphaerae TaxID=762836 RepID=A0A1E7WFC5_9BURK|nr:MULTISPECIES: SRPBCC family protein [Duganella]MDR7047666.1 hypothetical protein [Duganella sp. 3397]OEZ97079.1 hypothetical protein DUPY_36600 [Duganella phyllosphaerae]